MNTGTADGSSTDPALPYRSSWIDQLLRWIHSWPIPSLLIYSGIWLVILTIAHLMAWANGIVPSGSLDARILLISSWAPYCLGFIDFLNLTASRALDDFRPALDLTEPEFSQLHYEFTTMPARPVIVANLVGILLLLASVKFSPETTRPFFDTASLTIVNMSLASISVVFTLTAVYQTFRQLRLTRRTYERAGRLKLFQTGQLYAFSSLTVRIGIGWLVIIYSGVIAFPSLLQNAFWTIPSLLLLLSSAVSFVATLYNIHHRISDDKNRQLAEVNSLLEGIFHTINRRIGEQRLDDLARLREAASTLDLERTMLSKLPTWPWQPGTLASFLTALSLPLLVWIAQTLIAQYL